MGEVFLPSEGNPSIKKEWYVTKRGDHNMTLYASRPGSQYRAAIKEEKKLPQRLVSREGQGPNLDTSHIGIVEICKQGNATP